MTYVNGQGGYTASIPSYVVQQLPPEIQQLIAQLTPQEQKELAGFLGIIMPAGTPAGTPGVTPGGTPSSGGDYFESSSSGAWTPVDDLIVAYVGDLLGVSPSTLTQSVHSYAKDAVTPSAMTPAGTPSSSMTPSTYSTTPSAVTPGGTPGVTPGGTPSGATGGDPYSAMQAAQSKYLADQQLVAQGKLDPSVLTSDWAAYNQAAVAWQMAGAHMGGSGGVTPGGVTPGGVTPGGVTPSGYSGVTPSSGAVTPGSGSIPKDQKGVPQGASTATSLSQNVAPALAQWRSQINAASAATGVPADLIAAVIWQESGGNGGVAATTNPGLGLADSGVMQVDAATAQQLLKENPSIGNVTGMAQNIMLGAQYLKDMYGQFGSWDKAMRAYNSGPNNPSLKSGDLHAVGDGTDANYVDKVSQWWLSISQGKASSLDGNTYPGP